VLPLTAAGPAFSGSPAPVDRAKSVHADLDRGKVFDDREPQLEEGRGAIVNDLFGFA
jgi:hypothetical protein